MSTIETTRAMSSMTRIREETSSFMIQKTVRDHILTQGKPIAEDACTNYTNIRFTFEDDLNTSWVYKRSVSRGPSAFSIATSTKLTQSWSLLSGLSLSNISNIAVQCLPIYEHDLQNRKLYRFGEVGEGLISNPQFNPAGREPQPIFRRFFVPPTYTRHITSRRNFGAFRVKNPRPYRAFARYTLDLAEQLLSPAVIADLTQPDPASILFSAVSICYSDVSDCGPRSVKNSFTLHAPWLAYHIGEVSISLSNSIVY